LYGRYGYVEERLTVSEAKDRRPGWERAAWVATVFGALFAVIALWLSYWTFQRQTYIQANQAAHNATQDHIRLRVEHSEIIRIEEELRQSEGNLDELEQADYNLYVTVAEDGLAMAEYVYKLWRGDPGWEDTVESWIVTYRPYLLGIGLDCGDWEPNFVQFVGEVLRTGSEDFCFDPGVGSIERVWAYWLSFLVIAAVIIVLVILRRLATGRG
jgi:hypothetical protein